MSLWYLPLLAIPFIGVISFWMGIDWVIDKVTGGNW